MHTLWLWPEAEGRIRWFSAAGTDLLERPDPARCGSLKAREDLYEGGREKALSTMVDRPVAALLSDQVKRYGTVRLRLAEDLSAHWHTCAYERLLADGRSLFDRLVVERYASPRDHCKGGLPPLGKAVIFDLLRKCDRGGFYEAVNQAHLENGAQIYQGLPQVEHFLAQKDLSRHQLLCVLVHGTECAADRPFRLQDGSGWRLPLDSGLPPVVLLLVCGGFDGNLIDYGRHLLAQGARTVLAAVGKINAPVAGAFLSRFLSAWGGGESVAQILLAAQAADVRAIGARRLVLLGNGDLHAGEPCAKDFSDADLDRAARAGDAKALTALIDRITFEIYHAEGNLGTTISELYRRLDLPYDDPHEGSEPLVMLVTVADDISLIAKRWLHPFLGYLAQVHDHPDMQRFRSDRVRAGAEGAWLPDSPIFYHYLATPDYRNGFYAAGVKKLVAGFDKINGETPCTEAGNKLLGNLINHMIDLSLPDEAELLANELNRCLESHDGITAETDRFTLMDRQARIALRQGWGGSSDEQLVRALALFDRKRSAALRAGEDGNRELASLLYAAAWGRSTQAESYAREVQSALADVETVSRDIGSGNDTRLYLLRALALWVWRGQDQDAAELAGAFLDALSNRGFTQDSGPLGFATAFLALHRGELRSEQWTRMKALMEQDRYWLELTALSYLMGDTAGAKKYLKNFQHQRRVAFDQLERLPTWLADGAFAGAQWEQRQASLLRRERQEEEIFVHGTYEPSAEAIVRTGLMPM